MRTGIKTALAALVVSGAIAACGGKPEKSRVISPQSVSPPRTGEWTVDPELFQLFGPRSPVGRLPVRPGWSPDSRRVAYLRTANEHSDTPRQELWIFDLQTMAERPFFTDEASVEEYTWAGSETAVAVAGGELYQVDLDGKKKRLTRTPAAESSVAGSPDGAKVAFVRDHDLYFIDLLTGEEQRLTAGGSRTLTRGEVTWLYEEELGAEQGFGWSPDSTRLWFLQTDLGKVRFRDIPGTSASREIPYPRPGEPNPVVRVGVIDLRNVSAPPRWLTPSRSTEHYWPRVQWHPDSSRLLVTRLDRLQTTLDLVDCPAKEGKCATVLTERDPRYVNLPPAPVFVNGGAAILWLSERSGYSHIYRVDLSSGATRQLTEGSWVVTRINGVDAARGSVIFTANAEDSTAYKLYRIPLDGDGDLEGLSSERGCHEALFSPDMTLFLDTHSALDRPPRTEIKRRDGEVVDVLAKSDIGNYRAPAVMSQLFPFDTDEGLTLNALLTRPKALRQDRRYPVVVIVYGGPRGQLARDAFNPTLQPWRDLLARRGVLVFSVDGRGSFGRGRDFENAVRLRLGKVELLDQLAGATYLKTLPFVDPERIGIFGWSFGGTMVLNALLRTKDVFGLGVAVAPVTDWRLYDSAYTERYMQRPSDNPEGYDAAAVVPLAGHLKTPLLLVHGLGDENVQFIHSARLFEAMVETKRHVQTLFYPGKGHRLAGARTRAHLFSAVTRFIQERL